MKAFCVGDSHLGAIVKACNARISDGRSAIDPVDFVWLSVPQFSPNLIDAEGQKKINRELLGSINYRVTKCDLMVLGIGGNDHNAVGLINHRVPFDFVLREQPRLPLLEGVTVVPEGLLRSMLEKLMARSLALIKEIALNVKCRAIHIEPPPPIPNETHIRNNPDTLFKDRIEELGVAPVSLRYKLWRLQSSLYQAACNEYGIEFLAVPSLAQDDLGCLDGKAWGTDATHANAWYGEQVLCQIDDLLSRSR